MEIKLLRILKEDSRAREQSTGAEGFGVAGKVEEIRITPAGTSSKRDAERCAFAAFTTSIKDPWITKFKPNFADRPLNSLENLENIKYAMT